MKRSKHPNKEIEAAISYAEENGWTLKIRENLPTLGEDYCARFMHGKGIKFLYGAHLGALLIMGNKFDG